MARSHPTQPALGLNEDFDSFPMPSQEEFQSMMGHTVDFTGIGSQFDNGDAQFSLEQDPIFGSDRPTNPAEGLQVPMVTPFDSLPPDSVVPPEVVAGGTPGSFPISTYTLVAPSAPFPTTRPNPRRRRGHHHHHHHHHHPYQVCDCGLPHQRQQPQQQQQQQRSSVPPQPRRPSSPISSTKTNRVTNPSVFSSSFSSSSSSSSSGAKKDPFRTQTAESYRTSKAGRRRLRPSSDYDSDGKLKKRVIDSGYARGRPPTEVRKSTKGGQGTA